MKKNEMGEKRRERVAAIKGENGREYIVMKGFGSRRSPPPHLQGARERERERGVLFYDY